MQLGETGALGELGAVAHRKVRAFLDRAVPPSAVRDVAEMHRTLLRPAQAV